MRKKQVRTEVSSMYNDNLVGHKNMVTVGAYSPIVSIGNPMKNAKRILEDIENIPEFADCDIIVTPELSITGYTCQDMFFNEGILRKTKEAIKYLLLNIPEGLVLSVGAPIFINNRLFNCSLLLKRHETISVTPKKYIANYAEYYEARHFTSYNGRNADPIDELYFGHVVTKLNYSQVDGLLVGCEICEDLWAPDPVSTHLAIAGANLIINNSASNETVGKEQFRRDLVKMQSARTISAYVYCSAGMTESTQDVVFGGHNIIAENGKILAESDLFDLDTLGMVVATIDLDALNHDRRLNKTFSNYSEPMLDIIHTKADIVSRRAYSTKKFNIYRTVNMYPFVPSSKSDLMERCMSIFNMQVAGLTSRLIKTGSKHLVIGVSGGLDSTLALLVSVEAAKRAKIAKVLGVTMPCFGTTYRTKNNAIELMKALDCKMMEINIEASVMQHLEDIGVSMEDRSVAFENAQARERTQVLMDIANKEGGFVVGTGDMSELALGWCTYNGDHASMYNVNGSIPKTLVRTLVEVVGTHMLKGTPGEEIIMDIVNTPVSPELLPPTKDGDIAQLTEESVGPYVFNDFFMYHYIRYGVSKEHMKFLLELACKQSNMDYEEAEKWLEVFYRRFHNAQFKRNFCPDGVKVGSVSLNPRGDWRCPSEFAWPVWSKMNEEVK